MAMLALLTACSAATDESGGPDDSDLQSATVVADDSTPLEPTTTTIAVVTTTSQTTVPSTLARVASAEAESFKALTPDLVGVNDTLVTFVSGIDPVRVDDLAAEICGSVSSSMSDTELGVKGLAAYETLAPQERSSVSVDDWVVFYGAIIGFFCPENLPDLDLEAMPAEGTEVERFRSIVTEVSGVSGETETFVASLTDDRLDELQAVACGSSSAELTTEDFGVVIVRSYDADLTATEIEGIGLSAYSELYGAMVGWFCPGNLPR